MQGDGKVLSDEVLFVQLVSMFQVAAMQQMGKLPNPVTNEIERDMEQAKMSVDILAMLKEKTKGNLSQREEEFIKTALFEAQMNYVDELKRSEEGESGKEEGEGGESAKGKESEERAEDKSADGGNDEGKEG